MSIADWDALEEGAASTNTSPNNSPAPPTGSAKPAVRLVPVLAVAMADRRPPRTTAMTTITYSGTLTVTSCWCGIKHAVPDNFYERAQNDSSVKIYCPVGHWGTYKADRIKRLQEQLATERTYATHLRDQRDAAQRSANAYKGQATKIRKRVAKGVCPCCNRSFANLARHMAGQHPDYAEVDQ